MRILSGTLSRRALLGIGLGAAASSFLAACAPPPAPSEATAAAKVGAATGATPGAPAPTPAATAAAAKPAATLAPGAKELVFHTRQGDLANHFIAYADRWNQKNP